METITADRPNMENAMVYLSTICSNSMARSWDWSAVIERRRAFAVGRARNRGSAGALPVLDAAPAEAADPGASEEEPERWDGLS
jgi:hypothetical protein